MARNQFYTTKEIAELLKVHPRTIERWISQGKLTAIRLEKGYRVTAEDFEEFLQQRRTTRIE